MQIETRFSEYITCQRFNKLNDFLIQEIARNLTVKSWKVSHQVISKIFTIWNPLKITSDYSDDIRAKFSKRNFRVCPGLPVKISYDIVHKRWGLQKNFQRPLGSGRHLKAENWLKMETGYHPTSDINLGHLWRCDKLFCRKFLGSFSCVISRKKCDTFVIVLRRYGRCTLIINIKTQQGDNLEIHQFKVIHRLTIGLFFPVSLNSAVKPTNRQSETWDSKKPVWMNVL